MDCFTVALFGHRSVDDLRFLESRLAEIIKELTEKKEYVNFLIGRNGEFDEYGASVIKRTRKELCIENSELTLVLPYKVSKIEFYEKYYDNIIIPESVCGAYPKNAITLKNKFMIDIADLVIVYVERDFGGAYSAMKYARKIGKTVINISGETI